MYIVQEKLISGNNGHADNHVGGYGTSSFGQSPHSAPQQDSCVVDMGTKKRGGEYGSTVSFHNINYAVPVKVDGKKREKIILNDIK